MITLNLTEQHFQVVIFALRKLSFEVAAPVLAAIEQQMRQAQQPKPMQEKDAPVMPKANGKRKADAEAHAS